ncbi:MAG TPA: exonuclease domain-containing protein, partial [Anaerolineales bacterium]
MESFVALDVETTGLDAARDSIIEIAAVKFKGNRIEDEWSSLINPNRHVPDFITTLTGIDDAMLREAPRIREVAADFEAFVGDCPIVSHNVHFDLDFLRRYIPFALNDVIDTYELAAVLLPNASRYNLAALCTQLGYPLPREHHRALVDAKGHMAIFLRLSEMARELPVNLVAEIVRLGEPVEWDANYVFRQVLQERVKEGIQAKHGRKDKGAWFDQNRFPPLENPEQTNPLDGEEAAALLEYGGPFSHYFESYEHRPEQVEMLRAVARALSDGSHLLVEAGTGVGKSFAYLIPAALFALRNNTRVVISTNTINLQDQLIQKDIPDLRAALQLDVRASVLKGRANYLCPRRVDNLKHFGPRNADELRVLAKILVWQTSDQSGDRNSINLNGNSERDVWVRLSAEDDACTAETCLKRTGGACPFHRARMAAQSAHLLVVNHALLLSDVATGNKVLPEYSRLIIDEGHHVESATTNALSFRLTQYE